MRLLLVLVLVQGLAPGLSAVGETVVHLARGGLAAEGGAAERDCDCGDRGEEQGCGATQHRCACCATQVLVPIAGVAPLAAGRARAAAPREEPLAAREQARPFRPPIS